MAINKVVYGDQTLVDLTQDTVEASNLLEGETAHDRSGNPVTGTAKQGHIVQNNSGTDMTQRSKLQFVGVYTEDDNTNNRTKVNIVREMTKEQMDALSSDEKKGFIRTTNEPNAPYSAISNAEINFTEASTRANIASGESISTLFGKIKKWFTDLPSMFVSKLGDTMSGHLTIDLHDGGADQSAAWSRVVLGNNIPKGTVGHSAGYVRFFGHGSSYTDISAPNTTDNRDITLPDKSGTIALLSDISGGGVTKDLLYTNPDPLSAFTAKTMNFQGLSAYDLVEIIFRVDTGSTEYSSQFFDNSISNIQSANYHYVMTSSNFMAYQRRFTFNSDSIVFQGGFRIVFNNTNPKTTYGVAYDKGMMPYKIFGWKFG